MHGKQNTTMTAGFNYYRPQNLLPPNANNKTFSGLMNNNKSPSNQPP